MNQAEAQDMVVRLNRHPELHAQVVRVLSQLSDPAHPDDNGWDVQVNVALPS